MIDKEIPLAFFLPCGWGRGTGTGGTSALPHGDKASRCGSRNRCGSRCANWGWWYNRPGYKWGWSLNRPLWSCKGRLWPKYINRGFIFTFFIVFENVIHACCQCFAWFSQLFRLMFKLKSAGINWKAMKTLFKQKLCRAPDCFNYDRTLVNSSSPPNFDNFRCAYEQILDGGATKNCEFLKAVKILCITLL